MVARNEEFDDACIIGVGGFASGVAMNQPLVNGDMRAERSPQELREDIRQDLRDRMRMSLILAALENIIKHDDEPSLKAACRARYCDLTDGKAPL